MTKKTSTGDLVRISIFDSREDRNDTESVSLSRLAHRVVVRLCETRHSVVFISETNRCGAPRLRYRFLFSSIVDYVLKNPVVTRTAKD